MGLSLLSPLACSRFRLLLLVGQGLLALTFSLLACLCHSTFPRWQLKRPSLALRRQSSSAVSRLLAPDLTFQGAGLNLLLTTLPGGCNMCFACLVDAGIDQELFLAGDIAASKLRVSSLLPEISLLLHG